MRLKIADYVIVICLSEIQMVRELNDTQKTYKIFITNHKQKRNYITPYVEFTFLFKIG